MTIVKYFVIGLSVLIIVFLFIKYDHQSADFQIQRLTIDTVKFGEFIEWIPQAGVVTQDSAAGHIMVTVPIDECYLARISPGLIATTYLNKKEFYFLITKLDSTVANGRFNVVMNFKGEIPALPIDQSLRVRIQLGPSSNELLLPIGGFYKDTGGKWVFVVGDDNRAIKRDVKLGRRTTENFEVKQGLKPGDHIITSSYELFRDRDSIDVDEIIKLYKENWHRQNLQLKILDL